MAKRKILWIGGSSQLARSYYSTYGLTDGDDELFLCGIEASCPFALVSENVSYFPLDLTTLTSNSPLPESLQEVLNQEISSIIVGIRPVLMTALSNGEAWEYNQKILTGLEVLLQAAIATGSIRQLIHISSVAAANHLQAQVNHGEDDDENDANFTTNHNVNSDTSHNDLAPYDRFKRHTEALISRTCTSRNAPKNLLHTNLRISGLLFEEGRCIVTQSFELQARLGVYIPSKVDMNPARNVASAIRLILSKMEKQQQQQQQQQPSRSTSTSSSARLVFPSLYYYTRPTLTKNPIPMSNITLIYQRVCEFQWFEYSYTPFWIYVAFIYTLCHVATLLGHLLPYLQATDYLLRVSLLEHSFNNTRFQRDFPEIAKMEISVEECFQKRRQHRNKLLSKEL